MRLHNTLTRSVEEFKPIRIDEVKLYTCGPTVYDYAQLGNLRSFVFDDTLRRALEVSDYNVKHVMNITDVGHLASDMDEGEDKLEKGAVREGKTVWQIAQHYLEAFVKDNSALNNKQPNAYQGPSGAYARATDFIDEQVNIIKLLLEKGYAYQTQQAIYFDVSKLESYGELSGQKLEQKEVGARKEVITDPAKHHPQDFALWFFLVGRFKNHSMHWPSPWGEGFPGWHLECSAIIHSTLGDPIDIHTGGVDHIGTHHTNEMAQTEAAFGHKLANYWLHNEFLMVDGQKMSKSLGNFYTLKDITDKGYEPLALRLLFLQAHYRSQMNFTWESLEAAKQNLNSLRAWADLKHQQQADESNSFDLEKQITDAVANDLNTAEALARLNENLAAAPSNKVLALIDSLFGLDLANRADITDEQKGLLKQREEARQTKDWQKADEIRGQLEEQGIGVNDTDGGPVWYRL